MSNYQQLLTLLSSLLGALEIATDSPLYRDTIALSSYLTEAVYRIAVFAPFNHGKSTLLNALLGTKTLPIDLIPTTGAGIIVSYGTELATEITLHNGQVIRESGNQLLSEYAVLDQDRRMKEEVAKVRVTLDHPWLKTGVELLDLPGTNDREAQNELVHHQLLRADLIIHVLDARKLMTLEERQHLTQWLQDRGITRVVFVVNFLNLLTSEEQEEVRHRVCFIAESFRSNLPDGISNVYCVDALPALRARLKGDFAAAQATGLITLESALQAIASQQNSQDRLPRIVKIAELLLDQGRAKQQQLEQSISGQQLEVEQKNKVKQKASQLIQQGFNRSVSDFRGWLYLPKLLASYQANLAIALSQDRFEQWQGEFHPELDNYQQGINKWIKQGCEFFALEDPLLLSIDFPSPPTIQSPPSIPDPSVENTTTKPKISPKLNTEVNKILQGQVGAVVLGGASYILNKVAPKTTPNTSEKDTPSSISSQVYADAAAAYLEQFCDRANKKLSNYEILAEEYITFIPQPVTHQSNTQDYQLQLLKSIIVNLEREIYLILNT